MADSMIEPCLQNNKQYALGVEDLLGLQTGDAHIIRNAGGVVTDDAVRCLIISHHILNTNEIILIHHTRCGIFPALLTRTSIRPNR
jgi:carbonic anhydrase